MENNLQEILNERWPLGSGLPSVDFMNRVLLRAAFTEGYNARVAEEKSVQQDHDRLEANYNKLHDHSDFHTIR